MKEKYDQLKLDLSNLYDEQEGAIVQQISNIIEGLKNINSSYELPLSTTSNAASLDILSEMEQTVRIPSPITIGHLASQINNGEISIPALFDFASTSGFCIEKNNKNNAHQFIQNMALKIMVSLRPDLYKPIIFDVDGSGSNFSLLCGLEVARPNLVFTNAMINEKLNEILLGFSKLQTETLSYKFETLEELNVLHPQMAHHYTFIFIANFPSGFNSQSLDLLKKILLNGAKFGTFVFMSYDKTIKSRYDLGENWDEVLSLTAHFKLEDNEVKMYNAEESKWYNDNFMLKLEDLTYSNAPNLIEKINIAIRESKSKAITQSAYFDTILENQHVIWNTFVEADSKNSGIKVPIGMINGKDELNFVIDCDTDNYHAIIGGKTGSGKTVLLDNIIINTALKYSPQEVQLILMDFKGASFQKYKNLPHIKILFGGSESFYGLNVLRFLKMENNRRQLLLADRGGKISALNKQQRIELNFPRLVVILDEFQILLKENDDISKESKSLIDTITQQGRSAGIHLILASQDLLGVTLNESTQSNCNVRIGLKMEVTPCQFIFSRENLAPTQLEKKGEAIYNDKSARPVFGNIKFQNYYLQDEMAQNLVDYIIAFNNTANLPAIEKTILPLEGKAVYMPSKLKFINGETSQRNYSEFDIQIGEPTFIKVNPETFLKESAYYRMKFAENSNVLISGNDVSAAFKIVSLSMFQVATQQNSDFTLYIYNGFGIDKTDIRDCLKRFEQQIEKALYFNPETVNGLFDQLIMDFETRKANRDQIQGHSYLFLCNLDASFQKTMSGFPEIVNKLNIILRQGSALGLHVILYTYSSKQFINLTGGLNGISLDSFETKIVLKGDGADIITSSSYSKREPNKHGAALLYAPFPVTAINPDLITIYNDISKPDNENPDNSFTSLLKDCLKING